MPLPTPRRSGSRLNCLRSRSFSACAVKTDAQVKVWKDTVTLFSHVLEIDPRGEFPNSSLGVAYVRQGKFAEAQQYFERALVYNPSGSLTLSYSAYCLMQPRCKPMIRATCRWRGNASNWHCVLPLSDPDALTDMALWSTLMGRPKDEETYSRKALAAHPDLYHGAALSCRCSPGAGKLDEAAQEYRQVLAIEPDNYDAHNSLGIIYDRQGLKQEALKEFRLSLAINPDQAMAHSKIGRILMEMHQFPEAAEELTQALRFDPARRPCA